ncbi:MAG: tyrosine--tRNA ligase, partial [Thiobacillus sp.]|nr:tyrosine--tRNA ligase [Thiobacillus sp.]
QKFNLLMGREMQKHHGQAPQCILTMPLLEGMDGVNKMSKSLGNYIGINEPPQEIFGKLMSISDDLMWRYIQLLSFESLQTVEGWKQQVAEGANPRNIKVGFAQEIVARFHGANAATQALAEFEARFQRGAMPEDMPEISVASTEGGITVPVLLKQAGLVSSTSDAIRQIAGGGVRIDGERVADKSVVVLLGATVVAQVGKRRFARVTII